MADAAAPKPKRPRAPRKKADPNADLEVVPVGDKGTIFSLPTEILDQLIRCVEPSTSPVPCPVKPP